MSEFFVTSKDSKYLNPEFRIHPHYVRARPWSTKRQEGDER